MYVKCVHIGSIMTLCTLCFGSYGTAYIVHNTVYMCVWSMYMYGVFDNECYNTVYIVHGVLWYCVHCT